MYVKKGILSCHCFIFIVLSLFVWYLHCCNFWIVSITNYGSNIYLLLFNIIIYSTTLLLVDKENEISEDDECCRVLEMTSDGIATKIHGNKLGFYHSLETLNNDRIYQLKGSNKFLHRSSIGFWTVSDMFMLRIHSNQNLRL